MPPTLLHYSDLETALDDPEGVGALAGEVIARDDDESVVLGSGDNTAPGALSLATAGRAAFDFFGAVDADADTFGNHDFDFGIDTARELASESPQQWLCANAFRNGRRFAADTTDPHRLVETAAGTVGVIGVAHPDTADINPAAEGVDFADPVPAVQNAAGTLREQGAEYVAVVSHAGHGDERIARETDVDAVLGGHVHDVYADVIAGTAVVRPGRAGQYLAEVTLGDPPDVVVHDVDGTHRDVELTTAIRDQLSASGLSKVVTTVERPIERTERAATVAESRIGNVVADALRWKASADVALSPPGAIRSGDPLAGEVTVGELQGLTPYDDDLVVVALPGKRLREAFVAVPLGYHNEDYPDRYCSHISGARVVWDDDAGELVGARVGGEPIDDDRTYTVAVADYLIETDFVNDTFDESDVVERNGIARQALVEYAQTVGLDPNVAGRIERPQFSGGPES